MYALSSREGPKDAATTISWWLCQNNLCLSHRVCFANMVVTACQVAIEKRGLRRIEWLTDLHLEAATGSLSIIDKRTCIGV